MALAQALAGAGRRAVIINADSAQVYADLAVLSARPSEEEMAGIPHRLFGTWDGAKGCSAADWAAAARAEIGTAHDAGAIPILVGGTGLYIRTLLEGIAPIPPIDPAVRAEVRAMPVAEAHAALAREDPARAALLHPADTTRVARALEVVRSTGEPLVHWQARRDGGIGEQVRLVPLVILPPREQLYTRCDARFSAMLAGGAIEEVRLLLARNLSPSLPVMRAIGVRKIGALLAGTATRVDAMEAGARATRQYAKRQYTWLRHQTPADWPRVESHDNHISALCASLLQ